MSDVEDDLREDLVASVIDSEHLILAVENRPALYNKKLKEYSDRNVKEKLWGEVCAIVIPNWDKLSSAEKQQKGKDVQKKWKNLKDCFARELAKQKKSESGQGAKKRRKYIYFDSLLFLTPCMEERPTISNIATESDNADVNDDIPQQARSPPLVKRAKKKQTEASSYEQSLLNILQSKSQEQPDEDKNFALMLVPMLKKLNDDQKHFAKVEILNAMKCTTNYNPSTTQPTSMSIGGQFQSPFVGYNIPGQFSPALQRASQWSQQSQQQSIPSTGPHAADSINLDPTRYPPQLSVASPSPSQYSSATSPGESTECSEVYDVSRR